MKSLKLRDAILLVVFCLITFFANRAALPTDIMESRNIITAREMVSDGNWLVPTMNGELRLEKPPLPTWVAGGIEKVFPDSLSAQRAAAGVMACMWVAYLFLLVRYVSRRNDLAIATTIVFTTCYNMVLMGRSATWDIYCHAFMMGAIYYLNLGLFEKRHYWRNFLLSGAFMGLSFLSKGPVSFYALLLPYLITLTLLPRPSMKGKWWAFAAMIVLMLAIGSWWYVYLLTAHPAEVERVIHKESGNWSSHNVRPRWYYWRFFIEMGVWAVLMLAALAVPYWKRHIEVKREYLLSVTWAIASLVLLSLMPEKKTRYLLPLLAPCSIVVACLIIHFKDGRPLDGFSRWLYIVNGCLISLVVVSLPVVLYLFGVKKGTIGMTEEVIATIFMIAVAAWLLVKTFKLRPMEFIGGIAALFAFAELFLLAPIGKAFGNPAGHSISEVRANGKIACIPFYHSKDEALRIELVYEAHRKILPLDLKDSTAVIDAVPFVLVSQKWVREELPPSVLNKVDTVSIGTFDDNKHPKTSHLYTPLFINHVTLVKTKKVKTGNIYESLFPHHGMR